MNMKTIGLFGLTAVASVGAYPDANAQLPPDRSAVACLQHALPDQAVVIVIYSA